LTEGKNNGSERFGSLFFHFSIPYPYLIN